MSQNDKSKGIFRNFWIEIIDLETAREAARYGGFVSGYLCLSYLIQSLFIYFTGNLLFSNTPPVDGIEFYITLVVTLAASLLFSYVCFDIFKRKKYGFVPYISIWLIIEIVYKFFLVSSKGIFISIIIFFLSLNAYRGWLGIRKFNKTEEVEIKKKRGWIKFIGIPISLILLSLIFFGVLTETSMLPSTYVQTGSELSQKEKNKLINHKIIDKNDNILFFYSEGIFSIIYGGQLITNDKVISYIMNEKKLLEIYEMPLNNVQEIVLETKGSFIEDSVYKIIGDENADYEYIVIVLSTEKNRNIDFINAIKKRMN